MRVSRSPAAPRTPAVPGWGVLLCLTALPLAANAQSIGPRAPSEDTVRAARIRGPFGSPLTTRGPWGTITVEVMEIEPDPETIPGDTCPSDYGRWAFPGYTAARLDAWYATLHIPENVRRALAAHTECPAAVNGCSVRAPDAVFAQVPPEARLQIYRTIARLAPRARAGFLYEADPAIPPWPRRTDLAPAVRALLGRIALDGGRIVARSDLAFVCGSVDETMRRRIVASVAARSAVRARIRVERGPGLEGAIRYWSLAGEGARVRDLLTRAANRPGGSFVDVVDLLPSLARTNWGRYSAPGAPLRDCVWTSTHFGTGPSAPSTVDGLPALDGYLASQAARIPLDERRLGDLVVFRDASRAPLHVAVAIAADVFFTKNGESPLAPWQLATLAQLRRQYPGTEVIDAWRVRATTGPRCDPRTESCPP